jgi:hypothetical protein
VRGKGMLAEVGMGSARVFSSTHPIMQKIENNRSTDGTLHEVSPAVTGDNISSPKGKVYLFPFLHYSERVYALPDERLVNRHLNIIFYSQKAFLRNLYRLQKKNIIDEHFSDNAQFRMTLLSRIEHWIDRKIQSTILDDTFSKPIESVYGQAEVRSLTGKGASYYYAKILSNHDITMHEWQDSQALAEARAANAMLHTNENNILKAEIEYYKASSASIKASTKLMDNCKNKSIAQKNIELQEEKDANNILFERTQYLNELKKERAKLEADCNRLVNDAREQKVVQAVMAFRRANPNEDLVLGFGVSHCETISALLRSEDPAIQIQEGILNRVIADYWQNHLEKSPIT